MSRNVKARDSVTISEEESAALCTEAGKLVFTRYLERNCALLLQGNRLTAAEFPDESKVGAIYVGKVKSVVKSIPACFVEIAEGEVCFLAWKDAKDPFLTNRRKDGRILEGDEFPVQVVRDAQKTKQASVSANVSLANDHFALTLGSHGVAFSGRLSGGQRDTLRKMLQEVGILSGNDLEQSHVTPEPGALKPDVPKPGGPKTGAPESSPPLRTGLMVRTRAGELLDAPEGKAILKEQFFRLAKEYKTLLQAAAHRTCFSCLKKPQEGFETILNSRIPPEDYEEVVTDDAALYERLHAHVEEHLPGKKVRLYQDSFPLEKLYGLHTKLEEALNPRVWLKCGGYLVIQPTEALTVIDVNSGKYEGGRRGAEEESAWKVDLEAAEEIALQLRLRNLSGIIVVDFINLQEEEHKKHLMSSLKKFVRRDKVKTVVVDMTPLGLVEITRKKVSKPLYELIGTAGKK